MKHFISISKQQTEQNPANTSILLSEKSIKYLKEKIVNLEQYILKLENEKTEIEKTIFEFNRRYSYELGDLILLILKKTAENLSEDPSKIKEYNRAKREYEDYRKSSGVSLKKSYFNLSEQEKNELKLCFRKACKLTHPDVVAEEFREKANKIFVELKDAYDRNDLEMVKNILSDLENDIYYFEHSNSNEKDYLLKTIEGLQLKVKKAMTEVELLKSNETYRLILSIVDWDEYFISIKQKLEKELNDIENE